MSDRRNGRQLERVPAEVLDPQPEAWAHPVPMPPDSVGRPQATQQPVVVYMQPPAQVEPAAEPSIRWDRLAAYVFGLAMLALVVVLLMVSGVLSVSAQGPQTQPVRQHPVDLVGPHR